MFGAGQHDIFNIMDYPNEPRGTLCYDMIEFFRALAGFMACSTPRNSTAKTSRAYKKSS
jgi:hypothetical protein